LFGEAEDDPDAAWAHHLHMERMLGPQQFNDDMDEDMDEEESGDGGPLHLSPHLLEALGMSSSSNLQDLLSNIGPAERRAIMRQLEAAKSSHSAFKLAEKAADAARAAATAAASSVSDDQHPIVIDIGVYVHVQ
jgi:hypothetical protein